MELLSRAFQKSEALFPMKRRQSAKRHTTLLQPAADVTENQVGSIYVKMSISVLAYKNLESR